MSTTQSHAVLNSSAHSITPLNELLNELSGELVGRDFVTQLPQDMQPFTIDASRPLTGVLTHMGSVQWEGTPVIEDIDPGLGLGLTEIDVTVTAEAVNGNVYTLGETTVAYTATPAQNVYREPWSVEMPAELDKMDFTGRVTMTVVVRGYNVGHGLTVADETTLTVPTYTASFDRRVEVAVDDSGFSPAGITLADDRTTWTGTIETPAVGVHTVRARAVQGWHRNHTGDVVPLTSPTATRTFTVTD